MPKTPTVIKPDTQLDKAMAALGDPTRLQIFKILQVQPGVCVSELAHQLGVSVSAVSQHCRILELSGVLTPRRQGHRVCYQLQTDQPVIKDLIKLINKHSYEEVAMSKPVTIYTTPTCVFCKMTKEYFKDHQVDYTEKDVTQDQAALKEMLQTSGQMGVPVITVGDEVVVGFNQPKLAELLKVK